jgi:hypothetical protein
MDQEGKNTKTYDAENRAGPPRPCEVPLPLRALSCATSKYEKDANRRYHFHLPVKSRTRKSARHGPENGIRGDETE